jgi:hypothetical protein
LLQQDVEVPVGYRTRGPNSRLIVVEGIGDMVLRNGKKLICLKLRRDPATGLEWTDYSADSARPERWNAPAQPDNFNDADGSLSVDALLARKQTLMTMDGEPINAKSSGASCCETGLCISDEEYESCEQSNPQMADAYDAIFDEETDKMVPLPTIPNEILRSQAARAGIDGVMSDFDSDVVVAVKEKAQVARSAKNRRVSSNVSEVITLELGSNANIGALEAEWDKIYSKNEDVLKGYEPYYSVDATADGDVRELFRLRVGPVQSIRTGDKICRKLGKRGFSCAVVRIQ